MEQAWFSGWDELGRVAAVGSAAYIAIVCLLRATGKRTLTQLNAFDFVVTIALGSVLAGVILNENVSLSEGIVALLVLVGWQYVLSWLSTRLPVLQRWIASEPRLLVHQGKLLPRALSRERITEAQVLEAARMGGLGSIEEVASMVLETNGTISVIGRKSD